VLTPHILPEVEMTCGRVVIINKGRVVAEDTPQNLTRRLRGAGALRLEVRGDEAPVVAALRVVPGVVQVKARAHPDGLLTLEVEADAGRDVRADLAQAIVTKGFGLLGLQQVGMSLEEIFLHLTTTDRAEEPSAAPASTEVTA
jgi:ABC-2 type transport system ATP-binding protein